LLEREVELISNTSNTPSLAKRINESKERHESKIVDPNALKCEWCGKSWSGDQRNQKLRTHACNKRDEGKAGAYFWYGVSGDGRVVYPVYVGFGGSLKESLRYLSAPGNYAIGSSIRSDAEFTDRPDEPTKSSKHRTKYVNNVDSLFKQLGTLYLTFIELDTKSTIGQSAHAEGVVLNYYNNLGNSSIKTFYCNSSKSTSAIKSDLLSRGLTATHYIQKALVNSQNNNCICFSKLEFIELVKQIKSCYNFKYRLIFFELDQSSRRRVV